MPGNSKEIFINAQEVIQYFRPGVPLGHNKASLLLKKASRELAQQYLSCSKDNTNGILYKDEKPVSDSTRGGPTPTPHVYVKNIEGPKV